MDICNFQCILLTLLETTKQIVLLEEDNSHSLETPYDSGNFFDKDEIQYFPDYKHNVVEYPKIQKYAPFQRGEMQEEYDDYRDEKDLPHLGKGGLNLFSWWRNEAESKRLKGGTYPPVANDITELNSTVVATGLASATAIVETNVTASEISVDPAALNTDLTTSASIGSTYLTTCVCYNVTEECIPLVIATGATCIGEGTDDTIASSSNVSENSDNVIVSSSNTTGSGSSQNTSAAGISDSTPSLQNTQTNTKAALDTGGSTTVAMGLNTTSSLDASATSVKTATSVVSMPPLLNMFGAGVILPVYEIPMTPFIMTSTHRTTKKKNFHRTDHDRNFQAPKVQLDNFPRHNYDHMPLYENNINNNNSMFNIMPCTAFSFNEDISSCISNIASPKNLMPLEQIAVRNNPFPMNIVTTQNQEKEAMKIQLNKAFVNPSEKYTETHQNQKVSTSNNEMGSLIQNQIVEQPYEPNNRSQNALNVDNNSISGGVIPAVPLKTLSNQIPEKYVGLKNSIQMPEKKAIPDINDIHSDFIKYNETYLSENSNMSVNLVDLCKNVTCQGNNYLSQCCSRVRGAVFVNPSEKYTETHQNQNYSTSNNEMGSLIQNQIVGQPYGSNNRSHNALNVDDNSIPGGVIPAVPLKTLSNQIPEKYVGLKNNIQMPEKKASPDIKEIHSDFIKYNETYLSENSNMSVNLADLCKNVTCQGNNYLSQCCSRVGGGVFVNPSEKYTETHQNQKFSTSNNEMGSLIQNQIVEQPYEPNNLSQNALNVDNNSIPGGVIPAVPLKTLSNQIPEKYVGLKNSIQMPEKKASPDINDINSDFIKYNETYLSENSNMSVNLVDLCKNVTCQGNNYLSQCCSRVRGGVFVNPSEKYTETHQNQTLSTSNNEMGSLIQNQMVEQPYEHNNRSQNALNVDNNSIPGGVIPAVPLKTLSNQIPEKYIGLKNNIQMPEKKASLDINDIHSDFIKYNETYLSKNSNMSVNLVDLCKNVTCQGNNYLSQCCSRVRGADACHGGDFSYLQHIPGYYNTTMNTTYNQFELFTNATTNSTQGHPTSVEMKPFMDTTQPTSTLNSCSCSSKKPQNSRMVRANNMNDFVKFQLMHGITNPDGKEMMNALKEASLEIEKVNREFHSNDQGNIFEMNGNRQNIQLPIIDNHRLSKKEPQGVVLPFSSRKILDDLRATISNSLIQSNFKPSPFQKDRYRSIRNQDLKDQMESIRETNLILEKIKKETEVELQRLCCLENQRREEELLFDRKREDELKELKTIQDLIHREFESRVQGDSGNLVISDIGHNLIKQYQPTKKESIKSVKSINNSVGYSPFDGNRSNSFKASSNLVDIEKFPELEINNVANVPRDDTLLLLNVGPDKESISEKQRKKREGSNNAKNKILKEKIKSVHSAENNTGMLR